LKSQWKGFVAQFGQGTLTRTFRLNIVATEIPGAVILEPRVFGDERGFFVESFHKVRFEAAGLPTDFVQDNHSRSLRGTLRGLHYQIQHPQGKLVRVIRGEVFDVAVDLRRNSPTFGKWTGTILSEENRRQFYVPPGMAHAFCTLSDVVDLVYKCTDFYYPEQERTIIWNDPDLAIDWPITDPVLSEKDQDGLNFAAAPCYTDLEIAEQAILLAEDTQR
jgi:dTDP-4-dehydrorhamnose 3,5-epimerase